VAALAALYRSAAEVGYALQFAGPVAAIVWLPVGVGMAFLYLAGPRFWPGVLIGDLLANDYGALPLGTAVAQTCGNVLEVLAAVVLLRRLTRGAHPLRSVRGLGAMILSIAAGTAVSATIGAGASLAGDVVVADDWPGVWRTWWLGDFSGALLVLPLALAWAEPLGAWWRRCGAETAAALLVVAALSELSMRSSVVFPYVVFPALLWSALRLGRRGATVAVAVAAGFAIWETTRRVGPFTFDSATDSILATQLYIAVSALSALCVAAVVAERETLAKRLAASRTRLVEAGARERRRLERDLHDGAQQRLTALSVRLGLAAEEAADAPEVAGAALAMAQTELAATVEELRALAHGIHPSVLTEHGLADALQRLAADSPPGLRLLAVPAARADGIAEATAYFVVSEAVANAHKHARATTIDVRAVSVDGTLRVEIADDGAGGASESGGSGLQGLRDRVEGIGGTFDVTSPDGRGTRIVAVLPARR